MEFLHSALHPFDVDGLVALGPMMAEAARSVPSLIRCGINCIKCRAGIHKGTYVTGKGGSAK